MAAQTVESMRERSDIGSFPKVKFDKPHKPDSFSLVNT